MPVALAVAAAQLGSTSALMSVPAGTAPVPPLGVADDAASGTSAAGAAQLGSGVITEGIYAEPQRGSRTRKNTPAIKATAKTATTTVTTEPIRSRIRHY